MRIRLLILLHFHLTFGAGGGAIWTYTGDTGPAHWVGLCQSGKSQSPVNLVDTLFDQDEALGEIEFKNYDVILENMVLVNNGHSVKVSPGKKDYKNGGANSTSSQHAPGISGGGLPPGFFRFAQFHFHWGSKSDRGSEHLSNGQAFPMEVHLVHYNTK